MKNSRKCPKCQSSDIVRVPGKLGPFGVEFGMTQLSSIKVTRYLCASCGFMEYWIDSANDIARVKKKYGAAPG
jgi:predicted nucleic-acid-binding Zn-ribbon protein